jgi:purine-nucleoside phosphorylase
VNRDIADTVDAAASFLTQRLARPPAIGVVLGSGLGAFADRVEGPASIAYEEIPHWPSAKVVGHAGRLVAGRVAGRDVVVLSGRAHFYEGYSLDTVVFGVRVLARLGVRTLVLTNAAGGINTAFQPGTLMVIDDHLNLIGSNPLIGPNDERLGPRFPDMTETYSRRLRGLANAAAAGAELDLAHGIYAAVHGPSYETPAEIRALRTLGADAVGMSTVPEAIAARHMGVEVLGLSCITNPAAGVLPEPLRHDEVMEVAARASAAFIRLLEAIVGQL